MNADQAYTELIRKVKECRLLGSCAELLAWDERTYMPHHGSAHRAEQMALLARLTHEMMTAPEVGQLVALAEGSSAKGDRYSPEAANVREIRRSYERLVKLPKELAEELARVTTRAQQVWEEARAADDFAAFQPWLENIVQLRRPLKNTASTSMPAGWTSPRIRSVAAWGPATAALRPGTSCATSMTRFSASSTRPATEFMSRDWIQNSTALRPARLPRWVSMN